MRITANKPQPLSHSVYFTENGEIWQPDSKQRIVHAILFYSDKTIVEGEHDGRSFSGLVQSFGENGIVNDITFIEKDGTENPASSKAALRRFMNTDTPMTLASNLTKSPHARTYMRELASTLKS